jgi:hypothetical protein
VGEKEHTLTIRFRKIDELKVTVDGRLCPFATTGIILIAVGSSLAI